MADLPTADQFFGMGIAQAQGAAPPPGPGGPKLPTAAEFFTTAPPQSGAAHDTVWSSLASAGARVLDAAGYGASQAWGAEPLGVSPDAERALQKAGVFEDFRSGHTDFLKAFNESIIRPAATAADVAIRRGFGLPAALSGLGAGLSQAQQEVQGDNPNAAQGAAGSVLGGLGELASGGAQGAFGPEGGLTIPHPIEAAGRAADSERVMDASQARSVGVVGEGEGGFYGAEPVTPENAQARASAAADAGMPEAPPPEPPAPDIHALARRIDPETFDQFDALALERDQHRATLERLNQQREELPQVVDARSELDELLGFQEGERVTEGARDARLEAFASSAGEEQLRRVSEAYDRWDALMTEDSPEMAQARSKLVAADLAMRDLAPQVSDAYRQASDLKPGASPEVAAVAGERPEEAPQPKPGAEQAPAEEKPAPAPAEGQPQAAPVPAEVQAGIEALEPPRVTGEQTLGNPEATPEGAPGAAGETPSTKAPTARYGNLRAVEGTGETVQRGLSKGVEAKSIEEGLTERFGGIPEYERVSMADQAQRAADLIESDYATAKAIALGDKQPPKGLLPESVFVGVEKRALAEGDVETLRQLATRSRLSASATTMGQRIRALGERDKASPVAAIQEVQRARETDLAKITDVDAAKRDTVTEIQSEMRKAASKSDAWESFLDTLKCGPE